jgi:hypothetical protein
MIVEPRGTQIDQIPMAFPLLFALNQRAIIAGAATEMRLMPAPSMNLLPSMIAMPPLKAPTLAPPMRQKRAISPTAR